MLLSTFLINHFELFGLQQAWFHLRGRRGRSRTQFRQPLFYKWVAPPALLGLLPRLLGDAAHDRTAICCWRPGMSVYMLIAIRYEERDLVGLFGEDYEDYREDVGMLIPRFGRRGA